MDNVTRVTELDSQMINKIREQLNFTLTKHQRNKVSSLITGAALLLSAKEFCDIAASIQDLPENAQKFQDISDAISQVVVNVSHSSGHN